MRIGVEAKVKIGATSWQFPGTYLDNVRVISKDLDFVELLVYTWDEDTKNLLETEIEDILEMTEISVHLPTDNLENVKQAVDFFVKYDVCNMTLHPLKPFEELAKWYFYELKEKCRSRISIENLENEDFYEFIDIYAGETEKTKITMDFGHLVLKRKNPREFYKKYFNIISEIHFHGVKNGKDHSMPSDETFEEFRNIVGNGDVPVCIETFDWEITSEIARRLKNFVR